MKLVLDEPETVALREFLAPIERRVSSELLVAELLRAVWRATGTGTAQAAAEHVLQRLHLVRIGRGLLRASARLEPPSLRALDSLHVATARSLGNPAPVFVSYDSRRLAAASDAGLRIASPA